MSRSAIRIVAISDTHGRHDRIRVPNGDVLIHAGDFTMEGTLEEVFAFDRFLAALPHAHKIVIAGNHDFCFERDPEAARAALVHALYLQDNAVEVEGIRFYGSPWQPWFFDWAFNLPRGEALREKWDRIPCATQVLVTHGPPLGRGDRTFDGRSVGCEELAKAVDRVRPRLHVFGHIHEGAGTSRDARTLFVNACACDLEYEAVHAPIVIDLPRDEGPARVRTVS
jgi:Icc-related predicted phosphoesterase